MPLTNRELQVSDVMRHHPGKAVTTSVRMQGGAADRASVSAAVMETVWGGESRTGNRTATPPSSSTFGYVLLSGENKISVLEREPHTRLLQYSPE